MANSTARKIHFEHLDVIRFLAAFMIVLLHAYEAWLGWFAQGIVFTESGRIADHFIGNFGIGVDIFFMLSGFLITYILLEEKKQFGRIAIGKFMLRRTLRIWPVYFFIIVISPLLVKWLGTPAPNYLANVFFVSNFETIRTELWHYPFAHFWSICIEEHFYLLWPFIIAFVPNKKLLPVFLLLIGLSVFFRVYTALNLFNSWHTIFLHTLSRMDVLVLGAIGAYFYSKKAFGFKLSGPIRIMLISLLIVLLCVDSVHQEYSILLIGIKKFLYMGILALLLLDFNFNPGFKHWLPQNSIIHYFGKISYGIYMYSNVLLLIIIKKIMWPLQLNNVWLFFMITISLSLLVPVLSYELVEKRILHFNRKFRVLKTER